MKLSFVTILTAATLPLAGCDSLDNLFHGSHHDATAAAASTSSGSNDTRYWDPQRNQWVAGPSASPTVKPASADPAANPAPVAPAPTPRASQATGVYNSSTGKIEWQNGGYIPPATSTPAPAKHWWWPF